MLGIGIDWAEEFHDIAFGTHETGMIERFRIERGPGRGDRADRARARGRAGPAEVRVVVETRHGLLVEALIDAKTASRTARRACASGRPYPDHAGRRRQHHLDRR